MGPRALGQTPSGALGFTGEILRDVRMRRFGAYTPCCTADAAIIIGPVLNITVASMRDRRQVLLRFVLLRSHPDTGVEEGVFGAAYDLRDSALTSVSDRRMLEDLLSWFEANLATPARFNRTKSKGYYRRSTAGVSWLKPTATEHIAKMRALIVILEENGYRVSQITTKRPGYVVFEDDHQVVAEPFRNAQK